MGSNLPVPGGSGVAACAGKPRGWPSLQSGQWDQGAVVSPPWIPQAGDLQLGWTRLMGLCSFGSSQIICGFCTAGGASALGTSDAKCPWGAGRWCRQPRSAPRHRQESIGTHSSLRMRVPPRWHTVGGVGVPTLAAAVASIGWCCTGTYQNLSLHHPQPSVAADTHRQE